MNDLHLAIDSASGLERRDYAFTAPVPVLAPSTDYATSDDEESTASNEIQALSGHEGDTLQAPIRVIHEDKTPSDDDDGDGESPGASVARMAKKKATFHVIKQQGIDLIINKNQFINKLCNIPFASITPGSSDIRERIPKMLQDLASRAILSGQGRKTTNLIGLPLAAKLLQHFLGSLVTDATAQHIARLLRGIHEIGHDAFRLVGSSANTAFLDFSGYVLEAAPLQLKQCAAEHAKLQALQKHALLKAPLESIHYANFHRRWAEFKQLNQENPELMRGWYSLIGKHWKRGRRSAAVALEALIFANFSLTS